MITGTKRRLRLEYEILIPNRKENFDGNKQPEKKKSKKPKVKKPSKSEMLEEAADLLKRIEDAERECQQAQQRMADIKDEYKDAKGIYSSAVQELRTLCRARSEKHPLFDSNKPKPEEQPKLDGTSPQQLPLSKDAWRETKIDSIDLSARYLKAFEESGLTTLGKVADLQVKHGDFWQREVKGLGEKGRDEYADRMATFWETHPEFCGANSAA